jgi:hypothetical protein
LPHRQPAEDLAELFHVALKICRAALKIRPHSSLRSQIVPDVNHDGGTFNRKVSRHGNFLGISERKSSSKNHNAPIALILFHFSTPDHFSTPRGDLRLR